MTALAATGVGNASWLVGSVAELFTTRYGVLLLAKTGLFFVMLLLATINRQLTRRSRGLDSVAAQPTLRALSSTIAFVLACGVAVIALVAVLGVTPPPAHEDAMHAMTRQR